MISRFDKSCAAGLLKREFAERIQSGDYAGACESLLEFTRQFPNPDFHKAFGMVYLLIAQDSDDRSYLNLAVREFMIYLKDHEDCREIYRNIFAAMLLLHDAKQVISWGEFIKRRGIDFTQIIEEIGDTGLDVFTGESQYDLALMFEAGEFGAIDIERAKPAEATEPEQNGMDITPEKPANKKSKVIVFKGAGDISPEQNTAHGVDTDIPFVGEDELDFGSVLDIIKDITEGGDTSDEFDIEEITGENIGVRLALRRAEQYAEQYKFDEALDELGKITSADADMYYSAECVRAYIYLSKGDVQKAHTAIKHALSVNPGGALAGTVLCEIYREQKRTSKIPATLKAIDYKDFIDADHVYKAAWLAIDYCKPLDALDLLQKYNDEYNIADVEMLYAQMMYNYGDRKRAVEMFYDMACVMYDDFSSQMYYMMAKSGQQSLPVDEEVPQEFLSVVVDGYIDAVIRGNIDTEDELFDVATEAFLTLEFDNDRATTVRMYDALRALCAEPRMRGKLDNALVSPYVEQSVKAVILAEKLKRGERTFLVECDLCPLSDDTLPQLEQGAPDWAAEGYAFVAMRNNDDIHTFMKNAAVLIAEGSALQGLRNRDIAQYLIRNSKAKGGKRGVEKNLVYALGYPNKTAAKNAYTSACAVFDGIFRHKAR